VYSGYVIFVHHDHGSMHARRTACRHAPALVLERDRAIVADLRRSPVASLLINVFALVTPFFR
jgi:hypothetical protein